MGQDLTPRKLYECLSINQLMNEYSFHSVTVLLWNILDESFPYNIYIALKLLPQDAPKYIHSTVISCISDETTITKNKHKANNIL